MGLLLRWFSLRISLTWIKRFAVGLALFYLAYALLGYLDPNAQSQGKNLLANLSGAPPGAALRDQAVGAGAALAGSNQTAGSLLGVAARLAMPAAIAYHLLGGADIFASNAAPTPQSGAPTTRAVPAGARRQSDSTRSPDSSVRRRPASY